MATIDIVIARKLYPGKTDAEVAAALAESLAQIVRLSALAFVERIKRQTPIYLLST